MTFRKETHYLEGQGLLCVPNFRDLDEGHHGEGFRSLTTGPALLGNCTSEALLRPESGIFETGTSMAVMKSVKEAILIGMKPILCTATFLSLQ